VTKVIKNLAASIRQQLKNLSLAKNRPFDEILRYYAIERFLYRLSLSQHATKFFLKGGLLLKVWNSEDHRATMDIDLLAKTSNAFEHLLQIITEITQIQVEEDAIKFDVQNLTFHSTQMDGDYEGVSISFAAELNTTHIPIQIDIGFNDVVIPEPCFIDYPTLLSLPAPKLMGYTPETVIAEKLESVIKLGLINTRMKDFYDLWTICQQQKLNFEVLNQAIQKVFNNRQTKMKYPISFTKAFYDSPATIKRWENFLSNMRKTHISLQEVISEISAFLEPFIK
jgi:predicted nucleotidyltransferase component of viral defense system